MQLDTLREQYEQAQDEASAVAYGRGLLHAAQAALDEQRPAAAIQHATQAMPLLVNANNEELAQLLYVLGAAHHSAGNLDAAQKAWEDALALVSEPTVALLPLLDVLIALYADQGRVEDLERVDGLARAALADGPEHLDAYRQRVGDAAHRAMERGDLESARNLLSGASGHELSLHWAQLHLLQGDADAALQVLDQGEMHDPMGFAMLRCHAWLHPNASGELHLRQALAVEALEEALALARQDDDPVLPELLGFRAYLALGAGSAAGAVDALDEAVGWQRQHVDPQDDEAVVALVRDLNRLGQALLDLADDSPVAIDRAQETFDEALERLQPLTEVRPDQQLLLAELLTWRAEIAIQLEDADGGAAHLDGAIEIFDEAWQHAGEPTIGSALSEALLRRLALAESQGDDAATARIHQHLERIERE